MTIATTNLLQNLIERTHQNLNEAEKYYQLSIELLNYKPHLDSWSILECLEHLNLYGDFYLREIEQQMKNSRKAPSSHFKPGLLGNYFAKLMLPQEGMKKMKTFKDKNPINSRLDKNTIERFINQQQQTLELLNIAKTKNLNNVKTGITISRWIRLKLGDTFRVVVYHNDRHIAQCNAILNNKKSLN
ncbi:DinB family protein [uncultured Psychroserpens sp.]|uniref:DinB family protein n=1 Tax=uncultured Psychroserpens sp. TaxID=255436 RepID=UPI00260B0874|nr:DinB family protein [uncultured Psychroserpens sp.]